MTLDDCPYCYGVGEVQVDCVFVGLDHSQGGPMPIYDDVMAPCPNCRLADALTARRTA